MSRRLKYVMFSDAWWDEKRGRHRGRPRPLAARRHIWPKHCGCPRRHNGRSPFNVPLFMLHPVRTVLPRGGGKRYGWYDPKFITMVGTVDPL